MLQIILYEPVISCYVYLSRLTTCVMSMMSSAQVVHCILMCIHSRLISLDQNSTGAKLYPRRSTLAVTGANVFVALVESAPMLLYD